MRNTTVRAATEEKTSSKALAEGQEAVAIK